MNTDPLPHPETLLEQARAGDDNALGELLETYRNYLMLLSRMQMGRQLQIKAEPADIVQEVFLEALNQFAHFQGSTEGELVNWLRTILARRFANLVRRYYGTQQRDLRLEQRFAEELDASSHGLQERLADKHNTPSQSASRREQSVLLADALEKLPADYREVIILSHLEGLSFSDVALRMQRTVPSVKGIWARALAKLKRALRETND